MKTLCIRLPYLSYAKSYLKSGVEKFEDRKNEYYNSTDYNYGWGSPFHFEEIKCDTPFFIDAPKCKEDSIEKDLEYIKGKIEVKEHCEDCIILRCALYYSKFYYKNRVCFAGSIDSSVYKYLYSRGKKYPIDYSIEID